MKKSQVFVAMSGGVDSSVAAALLQKQGFNVTGVHIRCYNVDGCGERDSEDARRVAEQLGIPFYVFDFEKEYKKNVVQYMIESYRKGITPNPDVMCNKEIKFGLFLKKSLSLGANYIATGHYVRLKNKRLYEAKDKNKDQSYFLWTLTQKQLKHCLFPIGEYTKPKIRKLAKKFGLLTATKKDSQGICFLGQIKLEDFLKHYIKEKPGDIVDANGDVIGRHRGVAHYTIGQRHLGIKGLGGGPHFIINKDMKKNTVTVAKKNDVQLFKKEIRLVDLNLINVNLKNMTVVRARVRYRQLLAKATLKITDKKITELIFDKPQQYIAEGQSAVFYGAKGEMLGGGIII